MAEERKSRYTEAQNRATQKYIRENLEEIKFRVRKGEKDRYKAAAERAGISMAKFFLTAADEKMAQEAAGGPTRPAADGAVSLPSESVRTAQETVETEKWPISGDKAKALENLLEIFHDVDMVDLEKVRDERLGIVYFSLDTLETAQGAAEAAGEAVPDFIRRAVETQAKRDQSSLRLGINPATGGKLKKEA